MRKNFSTTSDEQVIFLDDMLSDRMRQLYAEIATYREKIALTTEPGLKATFTAVLELTERELAMHQRNTAARRTARFVQFDGGKIEGLEAWFARNFG